MARLRAWNEALDQDDEKVISGFGGNLPKGTGSTLCDFAIRPYFAAENPGDVLASKEGDNYVFLINPDKNAEGLLSALCRELMFQAVSANGKNSPILQ